MSYRIEIDTELLQKQMKNKIAECREYVRGNEKEFKSIYGDIEKKARKRFRDLYQIGYPTMHYYLQIKSMKERDYYGLQRVWKEEFKKV